MKRKLDKNNVPTPVNSKEPTYQQNTATFEDLGLDSRLLQALSKQEFAKPTLIQAKAIPLILEGKDVIARAKTGSGKTAAYVLPILQSILHREIIQPKERGARALLLVPTKELSQQVSRVISEFCAFCAKDIRVLNLNKPGSDIVQRSLLAEHPDVVVATPARVWANVESSAFNLDKIKHLVIDEADLVVSYGHSNDLDKIAKSLPDGVQSTLTSATMSDEVDDLTSRFCQNPVILALEADTDGGKGNITQFISKCGEDEKFLFLYIIMKLRLIKGKSIIFVEDIDRCYRVKLYLEQFGLKSCVLNSELPVNSRIHVVEEFNKGMYDIIIASDELEVIGSGHTNVGAGGDGKKSDQEVQGTNEDLESNESDRKIKRQKTSKRDKEYGISRGIDFRNVACVLNFDLPKSSKSYTHRIGRTGRAGKSGMALSFVVPKSLYRKHKAISIASTEHDEEVLERIVRHQKKVGGEVQEYPFDPSKVEGFKYRINDALRAVTTIAVREARTRELRNELVKSEKLKRHFEENPEDLYHLRHDGELRAARIQPHLKHVPDYLMPNGGAKTVGRELGFVGPGKTSENRIRRNRKLNKAKGKGRMTSTKRSDPLKTFNAKGRGKK